MMQTPLYKEIMRQRLKLGLSPECPYCQNTGYRTDYVGDNKPCTKCFMEEKKKGD